MDYWRRVTVKGAPHFAPVTPAALPPERTAQPVDALDERAAPAPSHRAPPPAPDALAVWCSRAARRMTDSERRGWETAAMRRPPIAPSADLLATAPRLPLLDELAAGLPKDFFRGVTIIAAQHGFASQEAVFAKFIELGVDPRDIYWAPVPYSSELATLKRVSARGVNVIQAPGAAEQHENGLPGPAGMDPLTARDRADLLRRAQRVPLGVDDDIHVLGNYHAAREAQLNSMLQAFAWRRPRPGSPILVLDDGGMVLRVLHERGQLQNAPPDVQPTATGFSSAGVQHMIGGGLPLDLLSDIVAVEQTTRGIYELERTEPRVPVVNVARSMGKALEAPFIAESVLGALLELLPSAGITSAEGRTLVVAGYGTVGAPVADLARALGFTVVIAEVDAERRRHAEADGFETTPWLSAVSRRADVLLGCSGRCSITAEVLEHVKPGCVVASGSSGEMEVDVDYLVRKRSAATPTESNFRYGKNGVRYRDGPDSIEGLRTHRLGNRSFFLARGGRPVNFDCGSERIPLEKIQLTQSLMFAAAVEALLHRGEPGLVDLSRDVQDAIVAQLRARWRDRAAPRLSLSAPAADARWNELTRGLAAGRPAWELLSSVDVHDAALGAPGGFPRTRDDRQHWCRVFPGPNGELVLSAFPVPTRFVSPGSVREVVAPALFVALPVRNETPIHVELLSSEAGAVAFGLWTQAADGTTRLRVMLSPDHGYALADEPSAVRTLVELTNPEVLSSYVADRHGPAADGEIRQLPPVITRRDGFSHSGEKHLIVRSAAGLFDVAAHAGSRRISDDVVASFADRLVLRQPLRLVMHLDGQERVLPLPADVTEVIDIVTDLNRDLVRGRNAQGQEVVFAVRWPVDWRSTYWPPGDRRVPRWDRGSIHRAGAREDPLGPLDEPALGPRARIPPGFAFRRATLDEEHARWRLRYHDPQHSNEPTYWETLELPAP